MRAQSLASLVRFNPVERLVSMLWSEATSKVVVWDETGNATPESKAARLDFIRERGKLAIIEQSPGTYTDEARDWLARQGVREHEYCTLGRYFYFEEQHKNIAFEFRMIFS